MILTREPPHCVRLVPAIVEFTTQLQRTPVELYGLFSLALIFVNATQVARGNNLNQRQTEGLGRRQRSLSVFHALAVFIQSLARSGDPQKHPRFLPPVPDLLP